MDVDLNLVERLITASVTKLEFGSQQLNTDSLVKSFQVNSTGEAPLTISSISIDDARFTLVTPVPAQGIVVPAGSSTQVQVKFRPDALGPVSGNLTINSDATTDLLIPLTGTGVTAATELTPSGPIDFGTIRAKSRETRSVTVRNTSDNGLVLEPLFMNGSASNFSWVSPALDVDGRISIGAGQQEVIVLEFLGPENTENEVTDTLDLTVASGDVVANSKSILLKGKANRPLLVTSPTEGLDFGELRSGTTAAEQTVTVSNNGQRPITFSSLSAPSNTAYVVTDKPTFPVVLNPSSQGGTPLTLKVTFTAPAAEGDVPASITLTNADASDPDYKTYPIELKGKSTRPILETSPLAGLDFGDLRAGTVSVERTVTVTNNGQRATTFSSLSAPSNAAYTVTDKPTFPVVLTPASQGGTPLTLKVTFTAPAAEGDVPATLTLTNSDTSDPNYKTYAIDLKGKSTRPLLATSPTGGLDFGSVRAGTTAAEKTVTVSNNGQRPITFSSLSAPSDAAYTVTSKPTFPVVLNPSSQGGTPLTLKVTFTAPATEGDVPATLTLTNADTSDPDYKTYAIDLKGKSTRPLLVTAPTGGLDFGDLRSGTVSVEKTVTVTNNGQRPITFSSISTPSSTAYTITSKPTFPVLLTPSSQGGTPLTLKVKFTAPATEGDVPASITLTNADATDPDYKTYPIELKGKSTRPLLVTAPAGGLDFGELRSGTTAAEQTVTVSNNGQRPITFSSLSAPSNTAYTVTDKPTFPVVLNPSSQGGTPLTLKVTFTAPATEGDVPATLTLTNSDATDPDYKTYAIDLKGKSTRPLLVTSPTGGLDFGSVRAGSTSAEKTVTVSNNGQRPITFSSLSAPSDTAYVVTSQPTFPVVLNPSSQGGTPLTLKVTFTAPTTEGDVPATLTLTNADTSDPDYKTYAIDLKGKSTRPLLVTAPTGGPDFGDLRSGTVSVEKTVTVTNNGQRPITFSSIGTPSSTAYTITSKPTFPVVLNPSSLGGAPLTLKVKFTAPATEGDVPATITLTNADTSDPDYKTYVINLKGKSTRPLLVTAPLNGLDFGELRAGTTAAEQTVTVSNNGQRPITFSSLSTPSNTAYVVTDKPTFPVVLNPSSQGGTPLTLKVTFTAPATEGDVPAILTLTNSDATDPDYKTYAIDLKGKSTRPLLVTSPTGGLDFGSVRAGSTSAEKTVTVSNNGQRAITFSSLSAPSNTAYTVTSQPTFPVVLTPASQGGTPLTLKVTFTAPATEGDVPASLTLTNADTSDPDYKTYAIDLKGKSTRPLLVTAPTGGPDFGDLRSGTVSVEQTVTVTNNGQRAITFSSISTPSNTAYTITSKPTFPAIVTPASQGGAPLTLKVKFAAPATEGDVPASITLTNADTSDPDYKTYVISLKGKSTQPVLTTSPAGGLNFGKVRAGTTTAEQTVTVTNSGQRAITFSSLSIPSNAAYTVTRKPTFPFTLKPAGQPDDTLELKVTFTAPAAEGNVPATLTLTNPDTTEPTYKTYVINLKGESVKPSITVPSSVDFGEVVVGVPSTKDVVINNGGSGPVTFKQVYIQQGDTAYALIPARGPNEELQADPGPTRLQVRFNPSGDSQGAGILATLKLVSEDPDVQTVSVPLTGVAIIPVLQLSANSRDFGEQNVGVGTPLQLSVSNPGSGSLRISNIAVTGAGFSASPLTPFDVTKTGGAKAFTVTFSPSAKGDFRGSLTFATNDPNNATVSIPLTGTGRVLLTMLPTSKELTFLDVPLSSVATQDVTLSNNGTEIITVSPPTFGASSPFSSTFGTAAVKIGPSPGVASYTFKVRFSPTAPGRVEESISFNSQADNAPTTLRLVGSGAEPKIKVFVKGDPTETNRELNYGTLDVDQSDRKTFTIKNEGSADLVLNGLSIVSNPATTTSPFNMSQPPSVGTILAKNETVDVNVDFAPMADGVFQAEVRIQSNALTAALPILLRGRGLSSHLRLSETAFNFGDQRVLQPSAAKTFTINNDGRAVLKIYGFSLPAGFKFSPALATIPTPSNPWEIPAQTGGLSLGVVFEPGASELRQVTGDLIVSSNAPNARGSSTAGKVGLSGKGVDGLGTTDPANVISFQTINVDESTTRGITITNEGSYPLTLLSATVATTSEPGTFTVQNFEANRELQTSTSANKSSSFSIRFNPKFSGTHQGTLSITTNSVTRPVIDLSVTALAQGAEALFVSSLPVNFGKVNVQGTGTAQLVVKNTGASGVLEIQEVTFASKSATGGASDVDDPSQIFAVGLGSGGQPFLPVNVAAQQTISIPLTFRPISSGTREAVLTVKSNARRISKDVTGEGTAPILKVEPNPLDFRGVLVGKSKELTATIRNDGNGAIELSRINLSSTGDGVFDIQYTISLPYILYPTKTVPVAVTFHPTAEKTAAEVQLVVTPSQTSGASQATARLSGRGVTNALSVDDALDFGRQLTKNSSRRPVTITNLTNEPIPFIRAVVDQTPGCPSVFKPDPARATGFTVAAFGTETLDVFFTPSNDGVLNCSMKLEFSELKDKIPVTLRGEGISSLLSVSSAASPTPSASAKVEFGSMRAGADSREEQFELRNLTSDDVELSLPEETLTTGERFQIDLQSLNGRVLSPDVPVYVKVKYEPKGETLSKSTLWFGTKTPERQRVLSVELTGQATKQILEVDESVLDFGRVEVKQRSESKTIVIRNSSSQLQRVIVRLRNEGKSAFQMETGSGLDIPAKGSATFTVSFLPGEVGEFVDDVLIRLQDSTDPNVILATRGVGRTLDPHGTGIGCSAGGAWGGVSVLALLALTGLRSRRRRRD